MKRTLSLVLVLAMVFTAMLGIIPAAEAEEKGDLEIYRANLEFGDNVYLLFAVKFSEVYSSIKEAREKVTLKVTDPSGNTVTLTPDASIVAPKNCVAFRYTELGAKNMADQLELQAYAEGVASGEAITYSILEYSIRAREKFAEDADLMNVIDKMLAFGASAQSAFGYDCLYDLSKKHAIIELAGGAMFEDGSTKKIVGEGGAAMKAYHPDIIGDIKWYNKDLQLRCDTTDITYTGKSDKLYAIPADVVTNCIEDQGETGFFKLNTSTDSKIKVAEAIKAAAESYEKSFTISMILAFGAAEGLTMHLRNNSYGTAQGGASNTSVIQNTLPAGKGQTGGRLNLLNSTVATGSYLGTRNRVDGNATSIRKLADAGLNRFMEIHIYFDLSGEADCVSCGGSGCQYCRETGKANLMHYYVDNNETPVSSVILPSKAEYFTTYGGGIAFEIQAGTNFKLRNFTISKGNVLQYID